MSPSTEDEIGPTDLRKQEQMATISRKHCSESDGIYRMESFISISNEGGTGCESISSFGRRLPIRHSRGAWALKGQPFRNRIRHSETFVARREICLLRPDRRLLKFGGVPQVIA